MDTSKDHTIEVTKDFIANSTKITHIFTNYRKTNNLSLKCSGIIEISFEAVVIYFTEFNFIIFSNSFHALYYIS